MFENPRRGTQARNFTTNIPKILDLKSSSEQIFSENWRWVPLNFVHNHRPDRPGGGVEMYIDADLEFKFRDDNWSQFPSSPF